MTSDLSSVRTCTTGRQPQDIRVSNRYPRPRTYTRLPFNLCHEGRYEVVQQVVVWFDCFYPDTQGCYGSLCTVYIQNRLSCGVAFFVRQCSRKWLPVPLPTQHPTYDTIVVASLAQCTAVAAKKENVIVLENKASTTCPPSGRAPLTPLPGNAHDFRPLFCPYFCYWPAAARHPGFQPLSPPSNLPSPPVQLVPRRTLRGGSAGGDLVRLFLPRHPRLLWFS